MVSWDERLRARVAALVLVAWFATAASGCSQLLNITDITQAPDAGDDGAATGDATEDAAGAQRDSSLVDGTPPDGTPIDGASDRVATPGDDSGDANPCTQDLSYVYTGPFSISFTLKTLQPDMLIALVNQRQLCTVGVFWDIRLLNGHVYTELSDINLGDTTFSSAGAPLNDDTLHNVVVSRAKGGLVTVTVDGVPSGSVTAMQSFDQLAPLQIGTDVCNGANGSAIFHGTLTNVCVRPE